MNREQKRAAIRSLQAKGHTKDQAKSMIAQLMSFADKKNMTPDFAEGDKVMIDLESIKRDADYPRFTDKYKEWIHAHADDVFSSMSGIAICRWSFPYRKIPAIPNGCSGQAI